MKGNRAVPPSPASPASQTSWQGLWRLSWPLILAMFFQFSVGITDVYVAGRFGPAVQGAVGFAAQMLFLFAVLANALGVGLVALVAKSEGAGETSQVRHASRQGLLLAGLAVVPLSVAGVLFSPGPRALGFLPAPVAAVAQGLLPLYAGSLAPQAVITVACAIFRARARVSLVLLCWAVTACLNLWGVFALSFGQGPIPALGPRGIAMATLSSAVVGAVVSLYLLARQGSAVGDRAGWRLDLSFARQLWRLSWPAGVLQVGWNLGGIALYAILGQLSTGAVAATAALTNGLRIEAMLYLPAYALNMVTAVLVGQALGAKDPAGAERVGWRMAGAAAGVLAILSLPVFASSRELAGLITLDPAVRQATHLYLRFNLLTQPFMALSVCLGGGLQGAGDTLGTMKIVLGSLWGVRIPLAAALSIPFGSNGVWASMVVSQLLQAAGMVVRFRKGKWKQES